MEEVLVAVTALEKGYESQARCLQPHIDAIRTLLSAEDTRAEALALQLEQRRKAYVDVSAAPTKCTIGLPACVLQQREAVAAVRRAFQIPTSRDAAEEPSELTDNSMSGLTAATGGLPPGFDPLAPELPVLAQVDQAAGAVDAALAQLHLSLGSAHARLISQVADGRRQLEVGRALYLRELQTLKELAKDQDRQTQTQIETLGEARGRVQTALQARQEAGLRVDTAEEQDETCSRVSDEDRMSARSDASSVTSTQKSPLRMPRGSLPVVASVRSPTSLTARSKLVSPRLKSPKVQSARSLPPKP